MTAPDGTRYALEPADVELATDALRREAGVQLKGAEMPGRPAGDLAILRDRARACRELSLKLAALANADRPGTGPDRDPLTRVGRLLAARLDIADVRDEVLERSGPVALALDNALELLGEAVDLVRALDDGGIACKCPTALRAIGQHGRDCPGHGGHAI